MLEGDGVKSPQYLSAKFGLIIANLFSVSIEPIWTARFSVGDSLIHASIKVSIAFGLLGFPDQLSFQ